MLRAVRRITFRPALRWPLLFTPEEARTDVELTPVNVDVSESAPAEVEVLRGRCATWSFALLLFFALAVPTGFITSVVADMWISNPSQRSWLLLGLGFYIVAALQFVYAAFTRACDNMWMLRTAIRRISTPTLFDAVTAALAVEAEKCGTTCSWDTEAMQEHDSITGHLSVKLGFWSTRSRDLRLYVAVHEDVTDAHPGFVSECEAPTRRSQGLRLDIHYDAGEDVVCGRDAHLQSRAIMVLSRRTSAHSALEDKRLLCKWLDSCYRKWILPVDGAVKVYALQESSADWVPEWKFERMKACKSITGTGQAFYLQRSNLQRILADARLWTSTSMRVYMITGPPGVGKSEFVIWLASQLALPIYRLCLSSPTLTDDRLAQLLSQSAITENAVLVQVDEFQETVQRWLGTLTSGQPYGVSPGGFCECVQGSTSMARGVMVLSGTAEIVNEQVQRQLAAVFRRIHCTALLGWMSELDIRQYFRHFLNRFAPGTSEQEWAEWEHCFLKQRGPWNGSRPVSIDMLKQYFMHQITEASCVGLGCFTSDGASQTFQVQCEKRGTFFQMICSVEQAESFLDSYAPVELVAGGSSP